MRANLNTHRSYSRELSIMTREERHLAKAIMGRSLADAVSKVSGDRTWARALSLRRPNGSTDTRAKNSHGAIALALTIALA